MPLRVWLRGTAATRQAAVALGCDVLPDTLPIGAAGKAAVLVVDDPSPTVAAAWVRRADAAGIPSCTIHDAGRTRVPSALVVDGSVGVDDSVAPDHLFGPRFAVLDPGLRQRHARPTSGRRVCIALGGGTRALSLVPALVAAVAAAVPDADIVAAPGFVAKARRPALPAGRWLASGELSRAMAEADVAIVAGGVTAYEASALGTALVAVSVVQAQRPTVRALAARGAALDGGVLANQKSARRVAAAVAHLLASPAERRRLGSTARAVIDGRGARRVAAALSRLAKARYTSTGGADAR